MAKIPQGILGGIRGRVGNVVGGAWKGINYIRSMPLSVANPNTVSQQAQRGKFTQVVAVARLLIADLVAGYWDPFAREMSGYNHFISVNIDAFLTAGLDDPAAFFSGRGILTGTVDLAVSSSEAAATIVATWTDNTGIGDALGDDGSVITYYNETQDYWRTGGSAILDRASEEYSSADTDIAENDVLRVWLFFRRPDFSKISDSTYVTTVVVA